MRNEKGLWKGTRDNESDEHHYVASERQRDELPRHQALSARRRLVDIAHQPGVERGLISAAILIRFHKATEELAEDLRLCLSFGNGLASFPW